MLSPPPASTRRVLCSSELSAESNTPDFWGIFTLNVEGDTLTVDNVTGDRLLDQQTTTFSAAG